MIIYIKIPVEKRLPDFYGEVPVVLSNNLIKTTYFKKDESEFVHVSPAVTHWLEEQDRVVLSEEQVTELELTLNVAQAEIRAMYKRIGVNGSNVLDMVDKYHDWFKDQKTITMEELYSKIYSILHLSEQEMESDKFHLPTYAHNKSQELSLLCQSEILKARIEELKYCTIATLTKANSSKLRNARFRILELESQLTKLNKKV